MSGPGVLVLLALYVAGAAAYAEDAPGAGESHDVASGEAAERGAIEALRSSELAVLCQQLGASSGDERGVAAARIVAAGPSSVATITDRLNRDLRSAPGDIERLLADVGGGLAPQQLPPRDEDPLLDVLPALLARERDESNARLLHEVTEVVVLLRALGEARTTPATRALLRYGPRERGVFQAEIARDVRRAGEAALPGLIQSTSHPSDDVVELATSLLRWVRRPTAGQQVQVRDPAVLAEILTVYGERGDRDTIPVLLAFTGSEIPPVREAARAAVIRFGRAILWPARIKYENFTGVEPDRGWGWQELSRRLFEAQDAARAAQVEQAMSEALEHTRAARYEEMLAGFDQILGRWPQYERRAEMVPGLVAFADRLEAAGDRARARDLLHQALVLAPEGDAARVIRARLLLVQVEADLARGVADPVKLRRIEELGLESERTAALDQRIRSRTETPPPTYYRMVAAVGLALFGLGCLGLLVIRLFPAQRGKMAEGGKG